MSKKLIFVFVTLGFYLAIIAYSDFGAFSENLSKFKIEFLVLVIFLNSLVLLIKGHRQQILLESLGINIPRKINHLLYLAGLSMLITPGGAGQVIKSYFLKNKFGINISKSIPLVFIERLNDLIAIISVLTFVVFINGVYELFVPLIILGILMIMIFTAFRIKKFYKKIELFLIRFSFFKKRIEGISKSYDGFQSTTTKLVVLKTYSLSLISWIIDAVSIYCIFLGFNLDFDIIYTTFVMFASLLLGFVTLLPSGLGVTELSFIGLLTNKGIEVSLATSIIIMIRLTSVWFSTIIGIITTKIFLKQKKLDNENIE